VAVKCAEDNTDLHTPPPHYCSHRQRTRRGRRSLYASTRESRAHNIDELATAAASTRVLSSKNKTVFMTTYRHN